MEIAKAAATAQIRNSAKFEALIGLGTSTLIFNSVVQNVLSGAAVPSSHIILIFGMVAAFFINRGINIVSHLSEMEARNRAAQIQAEIKVKELELQIELAKHREPKVLDPPIPLAP